jgi:hypothetical protein
VKQPPSQLPAVDPDAQRLLRFGARIGYARAVALLENLLTLATSHTATG